jgi:hypothetical protein
VPLAFAADAGPFAVLDGEDVGVAGADVAPGQVLLQLPGQHRVVRVVGATDDEDAQRPELRPDRVGPGRLGWGEVQSDLVPFGPGADGGGLVRREVVQDHWAPRRHA